MSRTDLPGLGVTVMRGPEVALVPTATTPGFANHGRLVGSRWKNASRLSATVFRPLVEGCVPSLWKSAQCQTRPSPRGTSPSAHRYGPHESHGDSTGPEAGSNARLSVPAIWAAISQRTAKPDSYAYGSGLSAVVA